MVILQLKLDQMIFTQIQLPTVENAGQSDVFDSGPVKQQDYLVHLLCPFKHKGDSTSLSIGTDFSGMEAPIYALDNLGIRYEHKFRSECEIHCQKMIHTNHTPYVLYEDIYDRDNNIAEDCDIYVAGFPCQPFSRAGKEQGFDDEKGRGQLFFELYKYIKVCLLYTSPSPRDRG